MGLFSLKKVFFWSLGILPFWGLTGCFAPPAFNGGSPSEPLINSDYYRDMEGRVEFFRNYLKISPQVQIPTLSPVYNETILYTDSTAIWEKGFDIVNPEITKDMAVHYSLSGVDPGDLQPDAQGRQMSVNLYSQKGERIYSTTWPVEMQGFINVNQGMGRYFNQKVYSLTLFTQRSGVRGYIKMTLIHIQIS